MLTITYCILHQIAFRQGAAILDAIRQGQPFYMAQQKMYSPQKWARSIVMLGAKLHSTCLLLKQALRGYILRMRDYHMGK